MDEQGVHPTAAINVGDESGVIRMAANFTGLPRDAWRRHTTTLL